MNSNHKRKNATHWERLCGTHREKGYEAAVSLWMRLPTSRQTIAWRLFGFCHHHWLALIGSLLTIAGWFWAR